MLLSSTGPMLDPALRILALPLQQFSTPPAMLSGGTGLPANALHIKSANLIMAGTPCAGPLFRDVLASACVRFGRDVMLVRTGLFPETMDPVTVDVALVVTDGSLVVTELVFMRAQDGALWLVPQETGPSFEIRPDGLAMRVDPPFVTWSERADGMRCCYASAVTTHKATFPAGSLGRKPIIVFSGRSLVHPVMM